MRIKNRISILCVCIIMLFVCGCGKKEADTQTDTNSKIEEDYDVSTSNKEVYVSNEYQEKYEKIISSDKIDVDEAYEMLKDANFDDPAMNFFVQELKALRNCSGVYVYISEDTNSRYTATVNYYMVKGRVKCSVDYTGYRGTISDGDIDREDDSEYPYKTDTTGDLYGTEQDFHMWFGPEKFHVKWADGLCEYVLDRGNGDTDITQDYDESFEKSSLYKKIVDTIETNYDSSHPKIEYVKESKTMNIYLDLPEGARSKLTNPNQELIDSWNKLTAGLDEVSKTILEATQIGHDADYVNIYIVDKTREISDYNSSEYLYWTQNGKKVYDYVNQ